MKDTQKSPAAECPYGRGLDVGLFVIRFGLAISFVFFFLLKQSAPASIFANLPGNWWPLILLSIAAFFVVCGLFTRPASKLAALGCAWAIHTTLHTGAKWFVLPVRDTEFLILFVGLAFAGPGKYSLDYLRRISRGTKNSPLSI